MTHKISSIKVTEDRGKSKRTKYEYDRLFRRGCNLSYFLYLVSIVFFAAWLIGNSRESLLIIDSSSFSRIFFFLNPNLFREVISKGNGLSWISGAVDANSFIFLVCYIVALFSFLAIICCAMWLFLISYHTSLKFFHYFSCLSVFPIVSCFLLTWFMLKLVIYRTSKRFGKISKFDDDFEPETFDEPDHKLEEKFLFSRPITSDFNYLHYKANYKKPKIHDSIKDLHKKISDYLS